MPAPEIEANRIDLSTRKGRAFRAYTEIYDLADVLRNTPEYMDKFYELHPDLNPASMEVLGILDTLVFRKGETTFTVSWDIRPDFSSGLPRSRRAIILCLDLGREHTHPNHGDRVLVDTVSLRSSFVGNPGSVEEFLYGEAFVSEGRIREKKGSKARIEIVPDKIYARIPYALQELFQDK